MTFKCDRCGRFVDGFFYMLALKSVDIDRLNTRDTLSMINSSVLCWDCATEFEYEIRHLFKDEEYLKACKELKESEKKLDDAFFRFRHTKVYRDKIEANERAIKKYNKAFEDEMAKED